MVQAVHEVLANAMLLLVGLHLTLLMVLSVLRGRNLLLSMWTGRMVGVGPDLVAQARMGLAMVLLVCVVAFGVWAAR